MPKYGFLVLSDITGYSSYLNESELEHAHESLTDLLNLLIKRTRSPLEIFKLEGDAVFSYAPEGGFLQGQTLVETIESTYVAFRKALDLMIINTTCNCNACRNIPNLDLKFFIHYGAFTIQDLGDYRELLGNDVNLVHRITKNRISEKTGLSAYAAFTQALVDHMRMTDISDTMILHQESFADVGEVQLYVHDMHTVWDLRSEEARIQVDPNDAIFAQEVDMDYSPEVLWDYITSPEYRNLLFHSDYQTIISQSNGRTGKGAVYVCAHGEEKSLHTVLDWQPLTQYSVTFHPVNDNFMVLATTKLVPTKQGTRLTFLYGKITGPQPMAWILNRVMPRIMKRNASSGERLLEEKMLKNLERVRSEIPPKIILGEGLASQAAKQSLVSNQKPD